MAKLNWGLKSDGSRCDNKATRRGKPYVKKITMEHHGFRCQMG